MIDGQTSAEARPSGTRMLSPPPVLHFCETKRRRAVSVLEYNRPGFESRRADICDRNVRGTPRSEGVQNFVSCRQFDSAARQHFLKPQRRTLALL
jgi:hypothetical protein